MAWNIPVGNLGHEIDRPPSRVGIKNFFFSILRLDQNHHARDKRSLQNILARDINSTTQRTPRAQPYITNLPQLPFMPSALEDPTQPPHYRPDVIVPDLEPLTVLLKDGETTATIYPISATDQLPIGLLAFLCDEFNMEIDRGDTYPLFDTLHIDTFQNYWFGSFAGVMLLGEAPSIQTNRPWEKECLGTFYIKPNYPGRCSHICTAGFLVNAGIRGKGIGRTLAECYLEWAPKLGYSYSVFNLVFETNMAARRIWESLMFRRIGRIKGAGILKGHENAVDALMYGRDLVDGAEESVGEMRFDKIKYFLETGRYPPQSDRQEKSRLRSSAAHYKLRDGKLMLKDREVIADPERQLQIATQVHMQSHAGINKTTTQITERYHWTRIKETVGQAIRNCRECRETSRLLPRQRVKKEDYAVHSEDDVDQHTAAVVAAAAAAAAVANQGNIMGSNNAGVSPTLSGLQGHTPSHMHAHSNDLAHHPQHHHPQLVQQRTAGSSLLGANFDNEDPSALMAAAVAAAQQQQRQRALPQQSPQGGQSSDQSTPQPQQQQQQSAQSQSPVQNQTAQSISTPSTSQPQDLSGQVYYTYPPRQQTQKGSPANQALANDVPVDPQVESAFEEHVHGGGEEIAIARALIQANVDSVPDGDNLFQ